MNGEIVKTSILTYEYKKDLKQYDEHVTDYGSVCISFEEFPENFTDVGEFKKIFILSLDNDSTVKKSDIVELHGKKMLMAFIKEENDKFMYAKFLSTKNYHLRPGEIIIEVSIGTNDKNYAQREIKKLYNKEIEWE